MAYKAATPAAVGLRGFDFGRAVRQVSSVSLDEAGVLYRRPNCNREV